MPQYLAIDYLTDILCRKQATLSRMLIVWPCHLSTISTISHNFKYRKPWLKGIRFLFVILCLVHFIYNKNWVCSRSHYKPFLFVKLTCIPLLLLSLLERSFVPWFLFYSILLLKGGFRVSFIKKIACLMVTS